MSAPRAPGRAWLTAAVRRALCRDDLTVAECRRLGREVYRLRLTPGRPGSVVIKRLPPAAAHRDHLLARRWLPAVGLAGAGPPLLATIGDPGGMRAWSVYAWLDGGSLDPTMPGPGEVDGLVDLVAALHVSFARHPLLAEARHHGAPLGYDSLAGRLDDALLALAALARGADHRIPPALLADLRDALCQERDGAPRVRSLLQEVGGPDTLLHGDLWPQNVMAGPGWLRLIDWDRAGVGPAVYDLSTLLLRLPPELRRAALDRYLSRVTTAGWPEPTFEGVMVLSSAAEYARLATLVSWRALDLLRSPGTTTWAVDQLRAVRTWWSQVDPHPSEVPVR
jgi:Ser/Thr protein kinase RdoA (MazF antagonist)